MFTFYEDNITYTLTAPEARLSSIFFLFLESNADETSATFLEFLKKCFNKIANL